MSELFDKSIRTLELPRVLALLSDQAVSAEARERALRVRPETETEEVLRLLDQTDAARTMIGLHGSPSFSGVRPVAEALERAGRGGALNNRELLIIADLLTAARRAREYFNADAAEKTAIDHLFLSLHGNRFLEEKIKRCLPDEDTVADAASSELADIRRHMRAAQAKSRQILQKIISSPTYGKILQETIITQRDGRFVVPVKAEHKGDLPGLVHDVSATGATLFVEPMGVVQANNEYVELEAKEQKEIERILAELSAEAAAHREDIQWDYDTLVHLDLIFARGQLSYRMNGVRPEIRRDGAIHLRKARHPLLDPKKAVPIDLELGESFDTLVITGPNTGGKTVSLKTLGLLTLMVQCGLHIPAADRSAVSVYERVLADIGDEQSIEQSLSTFSAHMVNIVAILKEADRRSLVLFDELGAGTDPVEGAALAIAVIQQVRQAGARVAATTHYAELKTFAMTTAGVENASCEFDVATLRPTYRLLIGVPGRSNAFAISERLGLTGDVIDRAKELISSDNTRFEDVVSELEAARQGLEQERSQASLLRAQAERTHREMEEYKEKLEKDAEREIEKARTQARSIVEQVKFQAELVLDEIEDLKKQKNSANIGKLASKAKSQYRAQMKKLHDLADPVTGRKQGPSYRLPRQLKRGDLVIINELNKEGTVLSDPDSNGNVMVQAGILKTRVPVTGLRLVDNQEEKKITYNGSARSGVSYREVKSNAGRDIKSEVDLRGMTTDEALLELDQYLDGAVLAGLNTVTIIHGKGTGALRAAVHQHLRKHKAVRTFRLGVYGEGESGVTIAELK